MKLRLLLGCLLGTLFCLQPPSAPAAVQLELDRVLNGAAPGSNPPWLRATFTTLFPGTVELTLEARLDSPTEFIGEVALNLNPALNPADLLFSSSGGPSYQRVNTSPGGNTLNLGGGGSSGGGVDITVEWSGGGGSPNRFDGTDSVTLTITGPQNLVAEDFIYFNTVQGADGPLIIGAHIQGIPTEPGGTTTSGAIIQSIPEPGAGMLLVFGLMVAWLRRCRRVTP